MRSRTRSPASPARLLLVAAALAPLACATGHAASPGDEGAPARAAAEARDADLGMAAAVGARDPDGFARFVAADAIFLGSEGPTSGREAVLKSWAEFFEPGGARLAWAPDRWEGSTDGDLAFTWGDWSYAGRDGVRLAGRYLTAWTRGPDGRLLAALDGDARPLPPLPAAVSRRALRRLGSRGGDLAAEAGLLLQGGREVGQYLTLFQRQGGRLAPLSDAGVYRAP